MTALAAQAAGMMQHRGLRKLLSFTFGSGIGLLVDISTYALLTWNGLVPGWANVVSSSISVVVVYVFVTRRTFAARLHPATFVVFAGWYGTNIAVTSLLIGLAVHASGGGALLWKLLLVPVSFAGNYLFNIVLDRSRRALGYGLSAPAAAQHTAGERS